MDASAATGDDGLKKLEYLSLVSKVCSDLETHLGFRDKVLAEFITEIGRCCGTEDEFDAKLKENGAELPDYLVRSLLRIIRPILPPQKGNNDKELKKEKESDGRKSRERANELRQKRGDRHEGRDRDRSRYRARDGDGDRDRDRGRRRDRIWKGS